MLPSAFKHASKLVDSSLDFFDFLFDVLPFGFQLAFVCFEFFEFLFRRRRSPRTGRRIPRWVSVWLLRLCWRRRWIAVAVGHRVGRRIVPVASSSSPISSRLTHVFHLLSYSPVCVWVPSVWRYGVSVTVAIAVAHPRVGCVAIGVGWICPPPSRQPRETGAYPRVVVGIAESPAPPASSESSEQPAWPLPRRQIAEWPSSWPWSPTSSSPTPSHFVHLYFVIFHIIF